MTDQADTAERWGWALSLYAESVLLADSRSAAIREARSEWGEIHHAEHATTDAPPLAERDPVFIARMRRVDLASQIHADALLELISNSEDGEACEVSFHRVPHTVSARLAAEVRQIVRAWINRNAALIKNPHPWIVDDGLKAVPWADAVGVAGLAAPGPA